MNANEGTTTNSGGGGSWIWQMEFFTLLNLGFDVGCLGLCIHLLTSSYLAHRRRRRPQSNRRHPLPSPMSTSGVPTARTRGNSVNGVNHASAANGTTSGTSGGVGNAPPTTFSVWAHKRQWIVLTSVLATGLWHLNRLLLIVVLSLDTIRRGDSTSNDNSSGDGFEWEEEERKRSENPLTRAPAVYIVVFLPVVLVLSRLFLVASFAFPAGTNASSSSSSAVSSTSNDEKPVKSPATTTPTTKISLPSSPRRSSASSSSSSALDALTSRMYGSRRNVYMLAFYACMGGMLALVPFTYNPVWYFDTPRIELMTSLYLAGVLQDAERVKRGLSAKEKRLRGLKVLERLVYVRWFVTICGWILLFLGLGLDPNEIGGRFVFDGSVLVALYKLVE